MKEDLRVAICTSNEMVQLCAAVTLERAAEVGHAVEIVAKLPGVGTLEKRLLDEIRPQVVLIHEPLLTGFSTPPGAVPVALCEGAVEANVLLRGLRSGIRCFLAVDSDLGFLPHVCRLAEQGLGYLSPSLVKSIAEHLYGDGSRLHSRYGLTPRETQILRLLCDARPPSEIGNLLGIKPRTVKHNLSNIYQKLGVSSATEAIVLAYKDGLAG